MTSDIADIVQDWNRYYETSRVRLSSDPNAGNRCAAYEHLLARGAQVLPYLREHWDDPELSESMRLFGFTNLLSHITHDDIAVPPELLGRVEDVHRYLGDRLKEQE